MTRLYAQPGFSLAWDNEPAFHVGQHAVNLRLHRRKSQSEVADAMNTSQSAVARIESGNSNITLGTLRKLINALDGRLRLSIEPAEMNMPRLPDWWRPEALVMSAANSWVVAGVGRADDDMNKRLGVGWIISLNSAIPQGVLISGEATTS